ncbi:MAG: hypothetical protein IKY87_06755 [Paludibacteraceae bacterium]|nr:hypothetical protein [Paludibacteraceae bacterium]
MAHFSRFSVSIRYVMVGIFLSISVVLMSAPPRWLRVLPKASNDSFRYVIESATATTEEAAYNKAMGLVLQHSIMSLGLPFNSKQVEHAITTGNLESKMAEWKIPVNPVCRYRQGLEGGGVRVYVLCQVAVAANIEIHFDVFRNCGNDGDKYAGQMNLRPDRWAMYELDTYFSAFEERELEGNLDEAAASAQLEESVKQALIQDIALKDSALMQLIKTEYHRYKNTAYAVAYVEREWVTDKYCDDIEKEIDVCYSLVENAESYMEEGNLGEAKALLLRVKEQLAAIEPSVRFLNAYSSSRTIDRYIDDTKELNRQINDKLVQTAGDTQRAKEGKIYEYIKTGQDVLAKQMVGDALRYFYAAQVMLADIQNNGHITVKDDESGSDIHANIYLQNMITQILKKIQVTCDGYFPNSETEVKLSFRYEDTPICNLNYAYNANMGWSDIYSVTNGWSAIFLPENNKPNTIHMRIEYRYTDEANFDAELPAMMKKYASRFNYDTYAKTIVSIVHTPIKIGNSTHAMANKNTTNVAQNIVANKVEEEQHKVNEIDAKYYHQKIQKVCSAIKSQQFDSIFTLFTMDGYKQFEQLVKYGKARVLTLENCQYIRIGTDVQCRSIPMNFSFSKGKQQLENVVFTFNNQGKIDGLQFALEERSARNVMGDTDIDELSRLTLINFLENYKTAFALKRLDYIESIFSDNAVIITGRVLRKSEQNPEFQNVQMAMKNQVVFNNVLYTRMSKEQYIKRLKNSFASKEWINIKFGGTTIDQSVQADTYGIRLVQDYSSNNYGDHGYLFLLVDASDKENPTIRIRTWQPETEGAQPFSMDDYDLLTNSGSEM